MKTMQITQFGQPPILSDMERPEPAPSEIAVKIAACGLNFADLLMIEGKYQDTPEPPFAPGLELAGTVIATGKNVKNVASTDRVAIFTGHGGLAEEGNFPAERAVALPDSMPFTEAAAFLVAYGTSHVALSHRANLRPGETLLVLGAAGGVGLTAVEIGKLMGATVIAAARGADKLAVAKAAGADHLIDTDTDDLRAAVKALGGADVVYDPVGGDLFKAAFRACNPEARIVVIGFASGDIPQVPANHLLVKNISVLGLYWGGYMGFRPDVVTGSFTQLFEWYAEGKLSPHVSATFPLERALDGLEMLRSRRSTGKVVITMDDQSDRKA
ncbi:NADPH:quinone oxidoreductase family protein [Anianabacter salinae]|uniref:NADPH:quinone oxidoreductase family protein n=1 Tax=Anianabacter salinae TaxID=2851023 RepID=UPI00225E33D2|nr:NADPH:quinone oxidoreductase family protein [Anianabacter salinae]MBV0913885.1 NADPH:quinone oxidoreductase family protein [Anianabacter salinae]